MKLTGALVVLILLLNICSVQAAPVLGITAEEPGPSIARLLEQRLPSELAPTLRSFENTRLLREALTGGEIDLAFLEEPLEGSPSITVVAELFPSVLHVLVPRESAPTDLGEVLGSGPVWPGATGSTGHRLAIELSRDYGVEDIKILPDPWSTEPTVYFIFGGLLSSDALTRLEGFGLRSMGDPRSVRGGSVAEGVVLRYPNLRAFLLPAEVYPTLARDPILTLSVKNLLVARQDLETDFVYELAMAVDRLTPAIAATYPLAGLPELSQSSQSPRVLPWHPGAQRYLDRELPSFLERYTEFMGAAATFTIALVSFGVAIYRRRRQARKDRLDTYYRQALDCRMTLQNGTSDRQIVADKLRALQEEVFELLIAERIDADSALVAFLTLSNQLISETGVSTPGPAQN